MMYELSIPTFLLSLQALRGILEKAVAHAQTQGFDGSILANSRLFPDMLPLTRQVQIASDAAKGAAARLAGVDAPKFEDNETTLPELIVRVDKTIEYLESFRPEQLEGAATRTITVPTPRVSFTFTGLDYLRHWAIPNFYFHVTTAYDLLRHNGVVLGKADFLAGIDKLQPPR